VKIKSNAGFVFLQKNLTQIEIVLSLQVPAQFTGSYEQYVNQICFITNSYSFDLHEPIPDDDYHRHEHELKYYQWTPFILLLMAILFYVPCQFWRGLSLRSGVDLKDLIEAAQTYRSGNTRPQDKKKILNYLANWLNSYCTNTYRLSIPTRKQLQTPKKRLIHIGHYVFFPIGIYTGNYLVISYLFIKFLYLLNSIGQILLLNTLLGRQFWYYGLDVIHRYWTKQIGILYTGSDYFPKVVGEKKTKNVEKMFH
jgi:innexin